MVQITTLQAEGADKDAQLQEKAQEVSGLNAMIQFLDPKGKKRKKKKN